MRAEQGGDPEPLPDQLTSQWRRSEERLSLTALAAPDFFQRALTLVGRTVDHLRDLGPGQAPLVTAGARPGQLVADAVGPLASEGLTAADGQLVAEAALAVRHREVLAELAARRRAEALHTARSYGQAWVVLETSGASAGDPFVPYRRLEAHAPTGRAVLVSTEPDADLTGCVHAVQLVQVDLETGALREVHEDGATSSTHDTAGEREQHASTLRQRISDGL